MAAFLNGNPEIKTDFLEEYNRYIHPIPGQMFSNEIVVWKDCVHGGKPMEWDRYEGFIPSEDLEDACVIPLDTNPRRQSETNLMFSLYYFNFPLMSYAEENEGEIYEPNYYTEEIELGPNIIYISLWNNFTGWYADKGK